MLENNETPLERIISALTYMTGGLAGIIWQIFCVMTKRPMSKFVIFNIYQSIFLAILIFLVLTIAGLTYNLLVMIPFVNVVANYFALLINAPVLYGFSVLHSVIFLMYLYLIIFSLIGRYAYLPWVSDIILFQVNRF